MRRRMEPANQLLHPDALLFGRLWYTKREDAIGAAAGGEPSLDITRVNDNSRAK